MTGQQGVAPQDVVVDLSGIAPILAQLADIRLEKSKLEDQEKVLTDIVKAALGSEGTVGQVDGETVLTFRPNGKPGTRFDKNALKADNPEMYEKYIIETQPNRPFVLLKKDGAR
ncbi:hypothetical protein [Tsukamurella sp. 1534]|uniref:hypothetical protein n=1 Tax=Tsukamurella sp. 1534 TaxID=1151061 RepID=UPI000304F032|nr:hypothetical protein [Tsukamurella sp. 1534]